MLGYDLAIESAGVRSEAIMHIGAKDLELYLLGQLTEDQTSAVAHHVSGCQSCASLLEDTKAFVERMRELEAVPEESKKVSSHSDQ